MIYSQRKILPGPKVVRLAGPQRSGLIAAWPLNEGGGQITKDALTRTSASLANMPTWTQGAFGNALLFDGVDDSISLGSNGTYFGTAQFSLSIWVKPHSSSSFMFTAGYVSGTTGWSGWNIFISSLSGVFYTVGANGSGGETVSGGGLLLHRWNHVVCVREPSGTRSVYVNGRLAGLVVGAPHDLSGAGHTIYLGTMDGNNWDKFSGALSDFRIYNRALSADDVKAIYRRPWELYASPRSLLYAANIEQAYNLWAAGHRAQQVWAGGHRAQQIWTGGHRIL